MMPPSKPQGVPGMPLARRASHQRRYTRTMPADNHRLFFALQPPAVIADRIAHAAQSAATRRVVRSTSPAKYHLTLHFLGNHAGAPLEIIDRAAAAAGSLASYRFELTLDRIDRFPGRAQSPWIARCSSDAEPCLLALRRSLGDSLARAGLGHLLEERFTPHVTIAYGPPADSMPIAIAPIVWPVSDFALMQSRPGQAQYDQLGHWRLRERSA